MLTMKVTSKSIIGLILLGLGMALFFLNFVAPEQERFPFDLPAK